MKHVKETVPVQEWKCSQCAETIVDENEYLDNNGVCDTCYSLPIKKRIGFVKTWRKE